MLTYSQPSYCRDHLMHYASLQYDIMCAQEKEKKENCFFMSRTQSYLNTYIDKELLWMDQVSVLQESLLKKITSFIKSLKNSEFSPTHLTPSDYAARTVVQQ